MSSATANAADVTQAYLAFHEEKSARAKRSRRGFRRRERTGIYAIQSLDLSPAAGVAQGEDLRLSGEVYSPDGRAPNVLIGIVRADGTPIYGVATDMDGVAPRPHRGDRYAFALTLPRVELLPGKYLVRAHALDPEGVRLFDNVERTFVVTGATREMGLVRLAHRWNDRRSTTDGDDGPR